MGGRNKSLTLLLKYYVYKAKMSNVRYRNLSQLESSRCVSAKVKVKRKRLSEGQELTAAKVEW